MAIVGSAEIVLTARLDRLERELRQAERTVTGFSGRAGASVGALGAKLAGLGAGALGIGAVTAGLYKLGTGAISASAQVESLKTRLTSLLGSQRAAVEEYARLSRLASTTPFTLQGVVEAGVTLRAFGEQNAGAAKAVADLAAFMGTDVVEAAQAYGRAFAGGAGAADILRERGVLTMLKLRTGIDDLTKLTLPEFRRILFEALVDPTGPIAGSTDRLSRTWQGAMANMEDATFNLGAALGSIVTESGAVRDSFQFTIKSIDGATESVTNWVAENRQWIEGNATVVLGKIADGFGDVRQSIVDLGTAWGSIPEPLRLLLTGKAISKLTGVGASTAIPLALPFMATGGNGTSLQDLAAADAPTLLEGIAGVTREQKIARNIAKAKADELALAQAALQQSFDPFQSEYNLDNLRRLASEQALFDATVAPSAPIEVPTPTPTPTGGAGTASRKAKRTPGDYIGDVLAQQRDFAEAAESRITKQIEILDRQKGKAQEIAGLERGRLQLLKSTLVTRVDLLKAQGTEAGELARAEADLANVQAELAAPAAQVADEFERATVAAERLGSTLSDDILGSVKQFTVGIAQGTANLKDFPRILSQSTAGNVTSRVFDAAFGAGGLFGGGTGAGDIGSFGRSLGEAFGFTRGNAPPEGFTGPPLASGATSAAGDLFAIAGNLATSALALGSIASAFGIGDLFKDKPTAEERTRKTLDDALKAARYFPTLAVSKNPPVQFRAKGIPSFVGSAIEGESAAAKFFGFTSPAKDFAGPMATDLTALGFLLGLEGTQAEGTAPRELGFRAGFLGLTEAQTAQQNRAVARATGKDVAEGVYDITTAFLRYQQEGKGAEITQREYNETVLATVKLLQDDLPAGIDASVFALDSLEQFGEQQVVNLENLSEALSEVADAAQGFASAFADGLGRAVESGDVMDVSRSLAEAFTSEFQDAAVKRILESGVFAADLQSAIALTTEAATKAAAGDFAGAAVLQARLGDTFSAVAGKAQAASAPLVAAVRGFEASLGVASASAGVIRQQPMTLVVQNVVDGRVVSEAQYNTERLQRGGGVIVPSRVGRA